MKPLSVPGRLPGRRLALAHVAAQKAGTTRHCRWFLAVYSGLGPPITKKGDCRGKLSPWPRHTFIKSCLPSCALLPSGTRCLNGSKTHCWFPVRPAAALFYGAARCLSFPFPTRPGFNPERWWWKIWFGGDTATVLAPPVQYIDY